MIIKELTCIGCPMGCQLTIEFDEIQKKLLHVSGNQCPKGNRYAHKELTNPTRIVTSSIKIEGGEIGVVSVKTQKDIPKSQIFPIMDAIHQTTVIAPVYIGSVLIHDVAGTHVDIIATKTVLTRKKESTDTTL